MTDAFRAHGCATLDLWSVTHPAAEAQRHPREAWLRRHLLGVPVHQGLTGGYAVRVTTLARRGLAEVDRPETDWPEDWPEV